MRALAAILIGLLAATPIAAPLAAQGAAPEVSPRPVSRTDGKPSDAFRRLFAAFTPKPAVCQDTRIEGQPIGPIAGTMRGCGLVGGVRVTSVSGIALSEPSVMDCRTARALGDWIRDGVRPAMAEQDSEITGITVVGHYVCRTRNHRPGAKISEHGKGRAIDIAGFELEGGDWLSVLNHWDDPEKGPALKYMHRAACGRFGTVLGPEADPAHRDHFHFDTAQRSRPYCR